MRLPLCLSLALSLFVAPTLAQVGPGGFKAGDIYLHTTSWSGISSLDGGIARIDPLSGSVTLLHDLVSSSPGVQMMAFDPWRDRLVFFGGFQANSLELYTSDAAGNVQSLGLQTSASGNRGLIAPRGDGIIYLLNPTDTSVISYLDSADQMHVLKDASGTTDWHMSASSIDFQSLVYVPATNSLVGAVYSFLSPCPGMPSNVTAIHRLDLSPDGSRVIVENCFWYDANPADVDGQVRGLSIGPGGNPLMVVGNGGTGVGAQNRIATIDMATNTASPFASVNFTAHHRIVGGVYSHSLGKAVVHDSFADSLRAYSFGQAGPGATIATGLSQSSSGGEQAVLTEIIGSSAAEGLSATTGTISLAGGGSQILNLDMGAAYSGLVYICLGSLSGWTPGTPVDGLVLPLNQDVYFDHTLNNYNQPPLTNSLGLLNNQGRATISFQLPPALDPALAGLVIHHAAAVLSSTPVVVKVSNAVPVELAP